MNSCKNCNIEIKKTNKFCSSSCAATYNNRGRVRSASSKAKTKEALLTFNKLNPNRRVKYNTVFTQDTKERISRTLKQYYASNPLNVYDKDELIRLNREAVHRSRAKKKGLLPKNADLWLIRQIYLATPDGYEVDHVKPFASGGLHHEDNLQYMLADDNRSKGQKYSEVAQR